MAMIDSYRLQTHGWSSPSGADRRLFNQRTSQRVSGSVQAGEGWMMVVEWSAREWSGIFTALKEYTTKILTSNIWRRCRQRMDGMYSRKDK